MQRDNVVLIILLWDHVALIQIPTTDIMTKDHVYIFVCQRFIALNNFLAIYCYHIQDKAIVMLVNGFLLLFKCRFITGVQNQ